jgi:hypothetical protein
MLARRLASEHWGGLLGPSSEVLPWHKQPYWTFVHTSEILRERSIEPLIDPGQSRPGTSPEEVRQWAELAATDLQQLGDMLSGQGLDLLDDLVERRPGLGVPGLDFE